MLMQNFGVTNKEHYGMLWYFLEWSIASYSNGSEEIASRWQNNSLGQTHVPWVLHVKFQIEKDCPVKKIAFLKNVCYPYLNFVLRVTYCF